MLVGIIIGLLVGIFGVLAYLSLRADWQRRRKARTAQQDDLTSAKFRHPSNSPEQFPQTVENWLRSIT